MSPEFGSTCAIFPIDAETLRYLAFSGRPEGAASTLVEAYAKEQGLWHDENAEEPTFSDTVELDLGDGRAVARRPEAPAGPRRAARRQGRLPRGAGRPASASDAEEDVAHGHDEAVAETLPGLRPAGQRRARPRARRPTRRRRPRSPPATVIAEHSDDRGRRRRWTARRSSSTTATS